MVSRTTLPLQLLSDSRIFGRATRDCFVFSSQRLAPDVITRGAYRTFRARRNRPRLGWDEVSFLETRNDSFELLDQPFQQAWLIAKSLAITSHFCGCSLCSSSRNLLSLSDIS